MSQILQMLKFNLLGTKGTSSFLKKYGVKIKSINKVVEGHPHIIDIIEKKKIQLIIINEGRIKIH